MAHAQFINPFTDFGFKKLFGEEASLPLLKDFLNALLPAQHQIETLDFRNAEFLGRTSVERRAVFDLYCQSDQGETFIVELQKQKQDFFKDRMVYYTTFPIQEQAEKGEWNFRLEPVYCIGILDFVFADEAQEEEVVRYISLKDQHNQPFYDKLTFITVEMPKFNKAVSELSDKKELWLYFLKNLEDLEEIPHIFMGRATFETAFEKAKIPLMNTEEHQRYQQSLKVYRDLNNVVNSAYNEGKEEGREQGLQEAMEKLIARGFSEAEARKILEWWLLAFYWFVLRFSGVRRNELAK